MSSTSAVVEPQQPLTCAGAGAQHPPLEASAGVQHPVSTTGSFFISLIFLTSRAHGAFKFSLTAFSLYPADAETAIRTQMNFRLAVSPRLVIPDIARAAGNRHSSPWAAIHLQAEPGRNPMPKLDFYYHRPG